MRFEDDYLFAVDEHGRRIRFTRTERNILRRLLHRPGQLVPRRYLLDAVAGDNENASERSVDFVINRLRRKLGDSARRPRFIDTHYGEGYRWLAPMPVSSTARAFIVIGPVRGVGDDSRKAAAGFAKSLRVGLTLRTRKDQSIVIDENCPPASAFRKTAPRFSIELDSWPWKPMPCIARSRSGNSPRAGCYMPAGSRYRGMAARKASSFPMR